MGTNSAQEVDATRAMPDAEVCWAARSPLKRGLDVVGGGVLLVLCAPVILASALLTKLSSPGPAFFVQERVGQHCRRFRIYKLRTMVDGAAEAEAALAARLAGRTFFKIDDDPRITRLGRFFRTYSIDELPQLVNVLKGEMSLVGPRPILLSDFERMPLSLQTQRFAARPGMTGLWQVSGRNRLADAERMMLDLRYVAEWSVWLDLKILGRTLPVVIRADGAY